MNKFKTVASFRDLPLAELARTKLESEGVDSFLLNKHHIGINWLYSQALGGVKVQVNANDFDIAQKILNTDESDYLNQSGINFPKVNDNDLCEHCHSPNIEHIKYSRLSGAIMLLGIPLLFWGTRLKCKDCGHKMKRKNLENCSNN